MQWDETYTAAVQEDMALVGMTLVRRSDGYTLTVMFTCRYPWRTVHVAVTVGEFGLQLEEETPTHYLEARALAADIQQGLGRVRGRVIERCSRRGTRLSIPTLMTWTRKDCWGILSV